VVSSGQTSLMPTIKNLDIPVVTLSKHINELYKETFGHLNVPLPPNIVIIGSKFERKVSQVQSYLYPEIYYRRAIGVPDSIPLDQLADLYSDGGKIFCVCVGHSTVAQLRGEGYDIEIVDALKGEDDYCSVTKRLALRWKDTAKGWLMGDPVLVSHWLPTACDEGLIAIYSVPQEKTISEIGDLISSKGKVVYGRQYDDRDFFALSKLNQCLQVIDPCRPPFQSVKHVEYTWLMSDHENGFYQREYSDKELRQFAWEGRILVSLMFWSGMIREIANLYNLMDLVAISRLRCGLVVTAQTYEYMMHSPFELLTIPLDQGGVYPLVEPVLGSCGIGVGIESCMSHDKLKHNLQDALSRILRKVKRDSIMPRGWWLTMDTTLQAATWRKRPKCVRLLRDSPYFQIRFHANNENSIDTEASSSFKQKCIKSIRVPLRNAGLSKYFSPYRPYELYSPGPIRVDIIKAAKSVGLEYMFTKAAFNSHPEVKHLDDDFIAMNYTTGRWDGWTPFETVNDISDLKKSERILLKSNRPGWIVGTIDSCLWTFSGEFWKRGNKLYEIARFCANGGNSGRLINVKPYTIARYARIMAEEA
jgi:hypothetical protein